ncbi:MAG: NAD+ synthase [Proteobacteria bacterium]|jgi:NAD+ synthase (glutamine-hydrolysing)|nr:NAD+ synthase [Pseudomonadota bacterium]
MPLPKIALAQINMLVGGVNQNIEKIITFATEAAEQLEADLVVFPELAVTGYPPEDLLLRPGFLELSNQGVEQLLDLSHQIALLFGAPRMTENGLRNCALLLTNGKIQEEYSKYELPNYSVFDEKRYFAAGSAPCVFDFSGVNIGITICEDIWKERAVEASVAAGAQIIININSSPFHAGKVEERYQLVSNKARKLNTPIIYVNQVGGQDELVFDGGSFCVNADGALMQRAECFIEHLGIVQVVPSNDGNVAFALDAGAVAVAANEHESIYQALVLGVRDYVEKNGFPGVILGLSGGIDSALTAAIAADALGPDRVAAVMMPFHYTSDMSMEDAESEANALGLEYHVVPIEAMYEAFMQELTPLFDDRSKGVTEQNIQARCRGVLLMALSNKNGYMVLTTGNKSEMAVGYATLYGDMVGGYSAIKDVPKMMVYELAKYRNSISQVIPDRVITRPPSAELAPDQVDEDSLPPYDVLDAILELYIEDDVSPRLIVEGGFAADTVYRVVNMVDRNEYKRRQAAPGVRISRRAFGRDRRYPITSGFKKTLPAK